jgi:hypothetical protein
MTALVPNQELFLNPTQLTVYVHNNVEHTVQTLGAQIQTRSTVPRLGLGFLLLRAGLLGHPK